MKFNLENTINIFFHSDTTNIIFPKISELNSSNSTELDSYILKSNIFRDLLLAILLTLTNLVMLLSDFILHKTIFLDNASISLLFLSRILYIIIIIPLIAFCLHNKTFIQSSSPFTNMVHYIFLFTTLSWSIFLTVNAVNLHGQMTAFLVTMFTLSFFITLSTKERIIFIVFPTILINLLLSFTTINSSNILGNILNSVFACVLWLLISRHQEFFFKSHYINSKRLKESNSELLHIKKTLETEVAQRSEELTHAHNLLIKEILDNHNYEMDFLKSQVALEKNTQRLKEIENYEQFRTEFFANISHELKTPLNVIFSAQQMLQKSLTLHDNLEQSDKYIRIIKQNCFRLIRLIGNLIDLTKLDSGYLDTKLSNNDIVSIVENITLSVASFIENQEIDLIFDTDIEECIIACDPENIERIILNLLSNSVKFTPKGGSISVFIKDTTSTLIIKVSDTGIGIPKDKQENIFDRFVQADKSIKRNREGSGIGLSLVKSLIELHSGTIELNSTSGSGTEFSISLPKRLVPISAEKPIKYSEAYDYNEHVEKISIEFSDIYM